MRQHRFNPTPVYLDYVGDPEYLDRINALLDEAETRLSPCPFCGGRAIMVASLVYNSPATLAQCSVCKCRTGWETQGYYFFADKHVSLEQTIEDAVDTWNRRVSP